MYTSKSKVKEIYANPIGRDIIDMLLRMSGQSPSIITNPMIGSLKIGAVEAFAGKQAPGMVSLLLDLLNSHGETLEEPPAEITRKWWKEACVYQIYPRSFQDSNGDGIGDLRGITERIPYLKELGVDIVWLSPIYDSPNDDMGYDIRDYRKIMAEFGTMADFDAMLDELHKNGIRLIMDLVVNHTSDEHEWFQKALADPACPEKDYYIWAKGKDGKEPNNWTSFFSGPAWRYFEETDEWALHLFSSRQMDLNWDNPALREEIFGMVDWWMQKGVDGFRMDVINLISKDGLEDGNEAVGEATGFRGIEHYFYGPRLHEYLRGLRGKGIGNRDAFTVGEMAGLGIEMCKLLTAEERKELDMAFNFDHLDSPGQSRYAEYDFDMSALKEYFIKWQQGYGNSCWQSLFFENHDNPRMVSKINPDPAFREPIAKMLGVLQFTLRGTPFIYQGQELGMTNTVFASADEYRDVETINRYKQMLREMPEQQAFKISSWGTRDHARTPMQWDGTGNAGFSSAEPWLKTNPNYTEVNAQAEMEDEDSVFHFFKELIALRKSSDALVYGGFEPIREKDEHTFCYYREGTDGRYFIEINMDEDTRKRRWDTGGELILGNYKGTAEKLRPYEANIYKL